MTQALSPGQRALIQSLLTTRAHELDRELQGLAEQSGAAGDSRVQLAAQLLSDDPESAREHPDERALLLERLDQLRSEQAAIGNALLALAGDDYGRCRDCGGTTPFDRLKAQPMALRCVDCASAAEQRAR